jgi:hypothetical protein
MQFVDSLAYLCQGHQTYSKILPNIKFASEIFSKEYRIPYQYTFHIMRKSIKPLNEMSSQEFDNVTEVYSQIFDQ